MSAATLSAEEAQRFLRHHPTPGATVHGLAEVFRVCERRALQAGDTLCREDDFADALFFILSGSVEVTKRGRDQVDRPLGGMEGPCLLGQVALVDRTKRTATCVVASPAVVLALSGPAFDRIVAEPTAAGATLRRLLLTSLSRQLVTSHGRLGRLVETLGRAADRVLAGVQPRQPVPRVDALEGLEGMDDLEAQLDSIEIVYGGGFRDARGRLAPGMRPTKGARS